MKKLFLLLSALCLATAMWADNVITYTATKQMEETMDQNTGGLYISGFGSPIVSHTFSNGVGTITFASDVTIIKPYSFYNCTELTGITIPNSVTSIGEYAFGECDHITSVTWNARNCNKEQEYLFFLSKYKITSFTFGPEVEVIPSHLCKGMSALTSLTIPNSVHTIEEGAFSGCSLTTLTLGNGLRIIQAGAFSGIEELTSLTLPASLETIGDLAFSSCSGIQVIHSKAVVPPTLEGQGNAFIWGNSTIPVYVPDGSVEAYKQAFGWHKFIAHIYPESAEAIESVESKQADTKTLRNGQVVILRGEKMYDMLGNEVK